MRRRRFAIADLLLLSSSAGAAASSSQAELSTQVSRTALHPGERGVAAVVFDIQPGFHAQSHTPSGESYIKFEVTPQTHSAVTWGEPVYPKGEDHEYPALGRLNVYTGRVVVYVPFEVKPDVPPSELKLLAQ